MIRIALTLLTLLFMAGCASNPPHIDYDERVDFSQYRTYAMVSANPVIRAEGASTTSPLFEERLINAANAVMQAKGFELVEPRSEADLQLSFTIGSREKISATSYPDPYWPYYGGWGAGWGGGGYYMGMSSVDVRQYTEGILAIDLLDVATRKPVWHGKATREITKKRLENPEESLNEVVADILQYFPPAPEEGEPAATTE